MSAVNVCSSFGLTLNQQDIYFDQMKYPDNPLYNIGGYIRLGKINEQKLIRAHQALVSSQDTYGLRISKKADKIIQFITDERTTDLPLVDLSTQPDAETAADDWLTELFETPLTIENSELFKAFLIKIAPDAYRYVTVAHHLSMDGWGFSNLSNKLSQLYNGCDLAEVEQNQWPEIAASDEQYLNSKRYQNDKAFWSAQKDVAAEGLLEPHYRFNLAERDKHRSRRELLTFTPMQVSKINTVVDKLSVNAAHFYLAIITLYFQKAYSTSALRVGLPFHNRTKRIEKNMLGVFTGISPLVIGSSVDAHGDSALDTSKETFISLTEQIATRQKQSFRHQRFPLGHLHRVLEMTGKDQALYDVAFNYLSLDNALYFADTPANMVYLSHNHEAQPIKFTLWDDKENQQIQMQIDYNLEYFAEPEVKQLAQRLSFIVEQVCNAPQVPLDALKILPQEQYQALTGAQTALKKATSHELSESLIQQRLEHTARMQPNSPAVSDRHHTLSYQALNEQANAVAHALIRLGVKPQDKIGICLTRTVNLLVTTLGILKAGAAYVSLDPGYPAERLQNILDDSAAKYVLTESHLSEESALVGSSAEQILVSDILTEATHDDRQNPQLVHQCQSNQLAYLIYTSGSTGQPKGVEICHANVLSLLGWAQRTYSVAQMQRVLASTSLNFDISVFELFAPICFGGECVIVKDVLELVDFSTDITLINTVPSAAAVLLENDSLPQSVKVINLAGEAPDKNLINNLLAQKNVAKVYNLYGPSEDTVYSSFKCFDKPILSAPSLGLPVDDTRFYVVSKDGFIQPQGIPGELYITGSGVSRGYLNRPELTAQVFIDDPFDATNSGKVYKTGDLVRQLPNGEYFFAGRIDEQIKIRGFRVELGEIQSLLNAHADVDKAVVLAVNDHSANHSGHKTIVAFVTENSSKTLASEKLSTELLDQKLLQKLRQKLPSYMIPSWIEVIEALPLTANGKTDKLALRRLALTRAQNAVTDKHTKVEYQTETQTKLAAIWTQILLPEQTTDSLQIALSDQFFALGGHSLQTVSLLSKINAEFGCHLSLEDVFSAATLEQLAAVIDSAGQAQKRPAVQSIEKTSRQGQKLPLSWGQQRIWAAQLLAGQSALYNMPGVFEVSGAFDVNVAKRAFEQIIERHEVLRTVYLSDKSGAFQSISNAQDVNWAITQTDLTDFADGQTADTNDSLLADLIEQHAMQPFDLSHDLMLKVHWVQIAKDKGLLLVNLHHIAGDAVSSRNLLSEFQQIYQAVVLEKVTGKVADHPVKLDSLPLQYTDYACWQRDVWQPRATQQAYWQQQLQGLPAIHNLPLDFPRPAHAAEHNTQKVGQLLCTGNQTLTQQLKALAKQKGVTLFMLLHSALALVLSRHSNHHDIVIGTPVANRLDQQLQTLIGFFVNTLVLRVNTDVASFDEYLNQVKQVNLAAQSHQEVPFELLVEWSGHELSAQYAPLFQIMFSLESQPLKPIELAVVNNEPITLVPQKSAETVAKFDLNIIATLNDEGIEFDWQYHTGLFKRERIEQLSEHLVNLLQAIVAKPNARLVDLELLSDAETRKLTKSLNGPEVMAEKSQLLHQLIAQQAEKTPEQLAVVVEGNSISYGELNRQSDLIARYLRSKGAGSDSIVGICLPRSVEMVCAIVASLKAGAAYLPMDANYPVERLNYLLEDSQADFLISESALLGTLTLASKVQAIALDDSEIKNHLNSSDDLVDIDLSGDQAAYIIYTSGSTGKPKGVVCRHASAINLLQDFQAKKSLSEGDNCALWTNISFDVSVYEMFSALCFGGTLHLVPEDLRAQNQPLFEWLVTQNIHSAFLPAFCLSEFADWLGQNPHQTSLKRLLVGVEPIMESVLIAIQKQVDGLQVINGYGPSETTICSVLYPIDTNAEVCATDITPIGKAVNNTSLLVLDDKMQLCPEGVVGELYIGGAGVAKGYVNQPELTAQRFVSNPWASSHQHPHPILYRTGDLVRVTEHQNLAFIGRIDEQIKIRGYRVEIGEICAQLLKQPEVKDAFVMAKGAASQQYLVAFIIAEDVTAAADKTKLQVIRQQIKQHLQQALPEFMIPARFAFLTEFPQLPNGKLDKKAFADIPLLTDSEQQSLVAPQTALEQKLFATWCDLLSLDADTIGIDSHFFELGGNSLLLSQMVHQLAEHHQLMLTPKQILQFPTIRQLAEQLESGEINRDFVITQVDNQQTAPLSASQFRIWVVEQLAGKTNQNNIAGGIKIHGQLSVDKIQQTLNLMQARHAVLRTRIQTVSGEPQQLIEPAEQCVSAVIYHDLSDRTPLEQSVQTYNNKADSYIQRHGESIFSLDKAPLMSALLLKLSSNEWRLHFNFHHMVFDGWSVTIFINQFIACYQSLINGDGDIEGDSVLAEDKHPSISYVDYANWQQQFVQSDSAKQSAKFWGEYLKGCDTRLNLPLEKIAGQNQEYLDSSKIVINDFVDKSSIDALSILAGQRQGSLFTVIYSALTILLSRLSGQNDVTIGIPVSGRNLPAVENLLGNFINNLPLRSQVELAQPFDAFVTKQVTNVSSVMAHQDLPYEHIVASCERKLPTFEVFLNLLSLPETSFNNDQFSAEFDIEPELAGKFDLSIYLTPTAQGMELSCQFNQARYCRTQVTRLLQQYAMLLKQIAKDSTLACDEYSLDLEHEAISQPLTQQLTQPLTQPLTMKWHTPAHGYFAKMVDSGPERIAIDHQGQRISYQQLDSISDACAEQLMATGVVKGDVVAIMAQRNERLIYAALAVLKAGAALVMLSEHTPSQRLKRQLELCQPACVITLDSQDKDAQDQSYLAQYKTLNIAKAHLLPKAVNFKAVEVDRDTLAYLAFTSGTEGEPKLIRASHSSLNAYIPWMVSHFELSQDDRFGLLSSLTHDPLLRDMFTPLSIGATLFIPTEAEYEFAQMGQWLQHNALSVVNVTPSLASYLLSNEKYPLAAMKTIFFCGESLTGQVLKATRRVAVNARMINLYGSTETARALSYVELTDQDENKPTQIVCLGKGIADVQLLVLNNKLSVCAIGEVGQIGIRSEHLCLGYQGDEQRNREKFVMNPQSNDPRDRIYLTGDLGRYLDDGTAAYLGRNDRQIKIRGFRIEPVEIEHALLQHPDIERTVVRLLNVGKQPKLVAFVIVKVIANSGNSDNSDNCAQSKEQFETQLKAKLQQHLQQYLPSHMIPEVTHVLSELPLTANGKLDELQLQSMVAHSNVRTLVKPTNQIEKEVLDIWQELLGKDDICVTDSFFDIGGHSLLATRFFVRIQRHYGIELSYQAFFEHNSVQNIAALVSDSLAQAALANRVKTTTVKKKRVSL